MTDCRIPGVRVGGTTVSPKDDDPATWPTWRMGRPPYVWVPVPGTANMAGTTASASLYPNTVNVWNGLAWDGATAYSILASGHGEWPNGAYKVNIAQDSSACWSTLSQGSLPGPDPAAGAWSLSTEPTPANGTPVIADRGYYRDGKPAGRHNYNTTWYVSAANSRDGIPRAMALTFQAGAALSKHNYTNEYTQSGQCDGFNLNTNAYDAEGAWQTRPFFDVQSSIYADYAQDPRNGDVWSIAEAYDPQLRSVAFQWKASTGLWTRHNDLTPVYPDSNRMLPSNTQSMPSLVDGGRNRLVVVHDGRPNDTAAGMKLRYMDLTTHACAIISITGDLGGFGYGTVVHDTRNDRYIFFAVINSPQCLDVYSIHPTTGVSTFIHRTATSQWPAQGGLYNRVAYVASLRGCALWPQFSEPVWFLPLE